MLLSKAIEGFILDAKAGRYSPAYIPTLQGYLLYICNYLDDPDIASIAPDDLKRYFAHLHTEYKPKRFNKDASPLSPASIDNHWKCVRGFFNWADEMKLISSRPDTDLRRPKYDTPSVTPFTMEEVGRLIEATQYTKVVRQGTKNYKLRRQNADRDKAIVYILLDTGMRLGELTRLRVGDVNLDNGEVHIRPYRDGRKSKARTVFLGARTRQAIWKYIATEQTSRDLSLPLFSLRGPAITNMIRVIGVHAGVHANPHKFRHTFAITCLRNGMDVFTLQRMLGHATLEMTKRYLDIVRDDIADAHRHASPVDNWRL